MLYGTRCFANTHATPCGGVCPSPYPYSSSGGGHGPMWALSCAPPTTFCYTTFLCSLQHLSLFQDGHVRNVQPLCVCVCVYFFVGRLVDLMLDPFTPDPVFGGRPPALLDRRSHVCIIYHVSGMCPARHVVATAWPLLLLSYCVSCKCCAHAGVYVFVHHAPHAAVHVVVFCSPACGGFSDCCCRSSAGL